MYRNGQKCLCENDFKAFPEQRALPIYTVDIDFSAIRGLFSSDCALLKEGL